MYKRCGKGQTGGEKESEEREEVQQICVPTSDMIHYSSTLNKLEGQTVIWLPFIQRCAVQMARKVGHRASARMRFPWKKNIYT